MQPTTHSHTTLFIIVAILALIAVSIFIYNKNQSASGIIPGSREEVVKNKTPIENAQIVLTEEQKALQEQSLANPEFSRTKTLTPSQQAAQKNALNADIKPGI
jgi:hypothetical protein